MEMGQVVFIVWRESVEAILVVGILYTWLKQHIAAHRGLSYLWGGVALGLLAAGLMGYVILALGEWLSGDTQEYFQAGMVLVAGLLIVHMVRWMRIHARTLKVEMETALKQNVAQANWWGVLTLTAIAIAREGSETVVFLYGILMNLDSTNLVEFGTYALLGFTLALLTFYLLQLGTRFFSWKVFFRVTELMLLFLAAALLTSAVEKLISLEILPGIIDPIWDTNWLLDNMSVAGNLASSFVGYRAQPALLTVLVYIAYWLSLPWILKTHVRKTKLGIC